MHYFFRNQGFRWESLAGWSFCPAENDESASLLVNFSDRPHIIYRGKEAEQFNDLLKSKSIVFELSDEKFALPQLEEMLNVTQKQTATLAQIERILDEMLKTRFGRTVSEPQPDDKPAQPQLEELVEVAKERFAARKPKDGVLEL